MSQKFDTSQLASNFSTLEKALSSNDDKSFDFISSFVDHFADVSKFQQAKNLFESSSVLPKLVERIDSSKNVSHVVLLLRLLMIFCRSEDNLFVLSKTDGIVILLNVMRRYPSDLAVQEHGCRCLINIGASDKNRKVIAKEGGIEVVLDTLKNETSPQNLSLIGAGVWALRNAAVNDASKKIICQKGGIELIVKAMNAYPLDLGVQTQTCWALENISIKEDIRDIIGSSGAVGALSNAMKNFPEDKKIQEACCWALSNLSYDTKCLELMKKESCTPLIIASLKKFPSVDNIKKHAGIYLSALGDGGETDSEDEGPSKPKSDIVKQAEILKKGFLTKQGGMIKSWKKRWFVLDKNKLAYYKSSEDFIPLGAIDMSSCEEVIEDPESKKPAFVIITQKRTFKIVASSKEEMNEWIFSIKKVQGKTSSPTEGKKPSIQETPKLNEENKATDIKRENSNAMNFDFFAIQEKVPHHELEAMVIENVIQEMIKSDFYNKISNFENSELLKSKIARSVADEINEKYLEEAYITNLRGERTNNLDASKIRKKVTEILESVIVKILGDQDSLNEMKKVSKGPTIEICSEQGARRTMEDQHFISKFVNVLVGDTNLEKGAYSFYGVFDGHGGARAAEYLAKYLYWNVMKTIFNPPPKILTKMDIAQVNDDNREDVMLECVREAFLSTNENFFEHMNRNAIVDACGSTAVVALQKENDIYLCWVGDSEAAIFKKDGTETVLCRPHKASSETEKLRIEELGGFIQEVNGVARMNGVLAVTRSFGDARFRRFVTSEPEITKYTLSNEDFMILACDGLWDVMVPKDVYTFVDEYRKKRGVSGAAEALVKRAIELNSTDNVSVILVFF